jgi:hypothetical protein
VTGAAGIQDKKVTAAHGHMLQLTPEEAAGRAPETLDDLFNEDGEYHDVGPSELGSWDGGHPWNERPFSNTGTDAEKKYRHRPQIYEFASGVEPSISGLHPPLRRLQMVVKSPKIGVMWDDGFSQLAEEVLDKNDRMPQITMGGAGWEFDVDCVKIAGTSIIADPNTPVNKLRVLNVGTPSLDNGTIFPFYFDPLVNPAEGFKKEAEMLSMNMGRPKGMTFGRPRPTPYHATNWDRSDRYVDAVVCNVMLDYIPFLCTVRSYQTEFRFQ